MYNLFGIKNKKRLVGIEIGTSNIVFSLPNRGVVLKEKTVIAIDKKNNKEIAFGNNAYDLIGRVPNDIQIIKPIINGTVSDFKHLQMILSHMFLKLKEKFNIVNPNVVIAIPNNLTHVEINAFNEVLIASRVRDVLFIPKPIASCIGLGININDSKGNLCIEIGSGTSELSVISFGSQIYISSIKMAGDYIDELIINYLKRNRNIAIGILYAQEIKEKLINCITIPIDQSINIIGRNMTTGLPEEQVINSSEIKKAIELFLEKIVSNIKLAFKKIPPELVSDIIENSIILTGGGSQIKNLDIYIAQKTNIPVRIAQNSTNAVACGLKKITEDLESYKHLLLNK